MLGHRMCEYTTIRWYGERRKCLLIIWLGLGRAKPSPARRAAPRLFDSIPDFSDLILDFCDSILDCCDSILAFRDSILDCFDSILDFSDSILDFFDSILAFIDSVLDFSYSKLAFYDSFWKCMSTVDWNNCASFFGPPLSSPAPQIKLGGPT